ncbi:MAG: hypothetical protein KDB10_07500 [Acidimicrobiales bacterium]|nr:hypothetical protein [Acidimicrobiales bacterium]
MTVPTRPRPRHRTAAVAVAVALAGLVAACGGSEGDGETATSDASEATATSATVASDEAIRLEVVPTPDGVRGARYAAWTADGGAIVYSGIPEGRDTVELLRVDEDGGDPACLTCDVEHSVDEPLLKALAFPDGERILVRVGEQSPIVNGTHAVVECAPSVADCADATLVPIEAPSTDDAAVQQPQREFRLSPDGSTVGFSQVRTAADGSTAFVASVGTLRRDGDRYVVDDARVVSQLGELKNFTPDGAAVLVSAFTTLPDRAADPDIVRIDLATGEQSDVTDNGDYDEDIAFAPDQGSYAVFSGRGAGLFETVSQVRRPNDIGPGLDALFSSLFVNHRKELLEPWLVPAGAEQQGELGRLLNPGSLDEGWDARTLVGWHPDGTRLLFWEDRGDPFDAPTADATRMVVVHLADRSPAPAPSVDPSPAPSWAPALAGYVPDELAVAESRDGEVSGRVIVEFTPSPGGGGAGTIEVTYEGYSDDGEWVVDGTESATFEGGLAGSSRYTADLTLSGDHDGFLRADATIAPTGIDGTIESEVDGRALRLP